MSSSHTGSADRELGFHGTLSVRFPVTDTAALGSESFRFPDAPD